MAAFFRGINARIRSNPTVSYICSTRESSALLLLFLLLLLQYAFIA